MWYSLNGFLIYLNFITCELDNIGILYSCACTAHCKYYSITAIVFWTIRRHIDNLNGLWLMYNISRVQQIMYSALYNIECIF